MTVQFDEDHGQAPDFLSEETTKNDAQAGAPWRKITTALLGFGVVALIVGLAMAF